MGGVFEIVGGSLDSPRLRQLNGWDFLLLIVANSFAVGMVGMSTSCALYEQSISFRRLRSLAPTLSRQPRVLACLRVLLHATEGNAAEVLGLALVGLCSGWLGPRHLTSLQLPQSGEGLIYCKCSRDVKKRLIRRQSGSEAEAAPGPLIRGGSESAGVEGQEAGGKNKEKSRGGRREGWFF